MIGQFVSNYSSSSSSPVAEEDQVDGNPVIDAFLKIGAIAEERQESLLRHLVKNNIQLTRENVSAKKCLQAKEQQIKNLRLETVSYVEKIEEKMEDLKKYFSELKDTLSATEKRCQSLTDKIFDLTEDHTLSIKRYEDAIKSTNSKYVKLKEDMALLNEHCYVLSYQPMKRKLTQYEEIKKDVSVFASKFGKNEKAIDTISKKVDRLEIEAIDIDIKFDNIKQNHNDIIEKTKNLQYLQESLKKTLDTNNLDEYKLQFSDMSKRIDKISNEINEILREAEDKKQDKAVHAERIYKLNKELYEYRNRESSYQQSICVLQQQLEERHFDCEKCIQEIAYLKMKITEQNEIIQRHSYNIDSQRDKSRGDSRRDDHNAQEGVQLLELIEKLALEQNNCQCLLDRIRELRLNFLSTQEDLTKLRNNWRDDKRIHETLIYQKKLTNKIGQVEKEWKQSLIASSSFLNVVLHILGSVAKKHLVVKHKTIR